MTKFKYVYYKRRYTKRKISIIKKDKNYRKFLSFIFYS